MADLRLRAGKVHTVGQSVIPLFLSRSLPGLLPSILICIELFVGFFLGFFFLEYFCLVGCEYLFWFFSSWFVEVFWGFLLP